MQAGPYPTAQALCALPFTAVLCLLVLPPSTMSSWLRLNLLKVINNRAIIYTSYSGTQKFD